MRSWRGADDTEVHVPAEILPSGVGILKTGSFPEHRMEHVPPSHANSIVGLRLHDYLDRVTQRDSYNLGLQHLGLPEGPPTEIALFS